jgi:hypothetical protein
MDTNKSHITLLVDRTGSMGAIRVDAEAAVNTFLDEQKKEPLPCTLLMVEFDNPGNMIDLHTIHDGDLQTAPKYTLTPRGNTPLNDALGMTITRTGERLAAMPEAERPGHVFFVVQTDGQENWSRDWDTKQVTDLIKQQERDYNWTFIFLGTGPAGFAASQMYKGTQMAAANTVDHAYSGASFMASYAVTGQNVNTARRGGTVKAYGAKIDADGTVKDEDDDKNATV